jgi:hypothetical protein
MFISKFKQWLDDIDPYGMQRIALQKALFIATASVYVYWLFRPVNFQSFIIPFIVLPFYESPAISSFAEKERLLIFIALGIILITVSFYLVSPFTGTFFFFSVFVLMLTYFSVLKYFYALKPLAMFLIVTGSLILGTNPPANLQVAYSLISSIALTMITALICLRIFPNRYLLVWNKTMQQFIYSLEEDIEYAIKQIPKSSVEEITQISIVRSYRKLIPFKYLRQAYRISINLRNIQFCLASLYFEKKNEVFWYAVKANLESLRLKMKTYTPCGLPQIPIEPETNLQHYTRSCLRQVFINWDKLCYLQQQ